VKPRRVPTPVETISVAPTILRLAGLKDPIMKQFQATSLVDLLSGGSSRNPATERPAYAETFYPFSSFGWSPLRSLQTERYHYIEAPEPELYDLEGDPKQMHNLAKREPARVARLRAELQRLFQRYQGPSREKSQSGLSEEQLERLRSLGYVAYRAPAAGSLPTSNLSDPKSKLGSYQAILSATDALHSGQIARGRALLKKVEESDPELYLIPFLLGQSWSREGNWAEAARAFEKCLERNPQFDQAMMGLARALHMQGESDRAQPWLKRALELNPQNFRAWYELGRVQAVANTREAAASFQKVLELQPSFAPAFRELGLLAMKQQNYTEAAGQFDRAVELGLSDPTTYNFLGIAYSRTNRLDLAVASYRRALAAKPDYAEAHLNLAYAYERLNQPAAARDEYETACRFEKSFCQYVPRKP
jgi:tetratricopeptide (TPR) repeat protein